MMRRMLAVVVLLIGASTGGLMVLLADQDSAPVQVARCMEQIDAYGCLTEVTETALAVGPAYALSALRTEVDSGPVAIRANCHEVAHNLGTKVGLLASDVNAVAKSVGTDAVLCDFGFVHGLLEGYAERRGAAQVLPLGGPLCKDLATNPAALSLCMHGFGHSVLISNDGDVLAAFEGCSTLEGNDQLSCTSGASMQWALSPRGTHASTAPPGTQYWPSVCETVEGLARMGCLSQIWHTLKLYEKTDERRSSGYAFEYCRDTYGADELSACVDGVGQILWADGQPDPVEAEKLCSQAGSDDLHVLCITGYANSRAVGSFDASLIPQVCEVVAQSIREQCLAVAERDVQRRAAAKDPAWKN